MPLHEKPPRQEERWGGYIVMGAWLMALIVVIWRVAWDLHALVAMMDYVI